MNMKKQLVIISVVAVLLAISTGVGFWLHGEAEAGLLVAEEQLVDAEAQLTGTMTQLAESEADLAGAQSELAVAQSSLDAVEDDLADTQTELAGVETELASTESELDSAETELTSTKADLADIEDELADTQAALIAVEEVFPPRYFESYNELEDWVEDHTPIAYDAYNLFDKSLELQEQALADGYIWSVFYGFDEFYNPTVGSEAVAGDSIYWIWLDGEIQWIAYR